MFVQNDTGKILCESSGSGGVEQYSIFPLCTHGKSASDGLTVCSSQSQLWPNVMCLLLTHWLPFKHVWPFSQCVVNVIVPMLH